MSEREVEGAGKAGGEGKWREKEVRVQRVAMSLTVVHAFRTVCYRAMRTM